MAAAVNNHAQTVTYVNYTLYYVIDNDNVTDKITMATSAKGWESAR